ncbi:hypothetical protein M409DRAFT_36607 [Zasmidium cellare ATCC 36951]|uniref:Amine oxidase n=1 Tax=Zasmidium cellare ATCC 36951 TaxID=1080233 RepID=A0A6A6CJU8_ZASCE|nr:uncharacterized protein M409DRAFT_36607 [Zasmidium cellare ATCC 36951]KAF2167507.1 hypothetical protein M409DRAFT_36607 [Zasmidium cellare ATCC 36951]
MVGNSIPGEKVDVVIVGAGFSGLQAAYDVHQAGYSCVVLEAKSRIGGRSYTASLKTEPGLIELGATWINEQTQPRVFELAKRFGLDFVEQNGQTRSVIQDFDGQVWSERGELIPQVLLPFLELMEKLQSTIDVSNPGSGSTPEQDMTVDEWLQQNTTQWNREFISNGCAALVGQDAKDLGLHYVMDYMKSGGGLNHLAGEGPDTAQHLKIKQGTTAIAQGLADALPKRSVLTDTPVASITQLTSGDVLVTTKNGPAFESRKIILAIPTNTYTNISFAPPLPPAKRTIVSSTKAGIYAKAIITYRRPWWRDHGLIGTFISMRGPINYSWELANEELQQYSIAAFIAGQSSSWWHALPTLKQEEALLKNLVEMVPQADPNEVWAPFEINIQDWTKEEYIGGGPTSSMGPGDYARYSQALREPYGNLYFTGGELAFEWKGYLEGAVRSGSRAAAEVVEALKKG